MALRRNAQHKYRAKPITSEDGRFASTSEYKRWCELKILEKAGEISDLKRQVAFPFVISGKPVLIKSEGFPNGRVAKWTSDFTYIEKDGILTAEDRKGMDLSESRLRRAIAECIYNLRIKVTK